MRFEGVVFQLNKPTTLAPKGARGHKVILLDSAIQMGLEQLPGKPLFAEDNFEHHDITRRIGIIKHAFLIGDMFCISGIIQHTQETLAQLSAAEEVFGFSYDLSNAHVVDTRQPIYEVFSADWLGVTVLKQRKTAYREDTLFWLV